MTLSGQKDVSVVFVAMFCFIMYIRIAPIGVLHNVSHNQEAQSKELCSLFVLKIGESLRGLQVVRIQWVV